MTEKINKDYPLHPCPVCNSKILTIITRIHVRSGETFGRRVHCTGCGTSGPIMQPLTFEGGMTDAKGSDWYLAWCWNGGLKLTEFQMNKAFKLAFSEGF